MEPLLYQIRLLLPLVFYGCEFVDSGTKKTAFKNYWPGSNNIALTQIFLCIDDNPMQLYTVVADGTNTNRAAVADVFANCDMAN